MGWLGFESGARKGREADGWLTGLGCWIDWLVFEEAGLKRRGGQEAWRSSIDFCLFVKARGLV